MTADGGVCFYFSNRETAAHRRLIMRWVQDAARVVVRELGVSLARRLHVCCYRSMEDSFQGLGRHVPATMAMAPYSSDQACLVLIHSPTLDACNGSSERMQRLIVHEFVHQVVAETTESTKILGDGNANMRVSSWLNEGIAEVTGFRAVGAMDRLSEIVRAFQAAECYYTFGVLSSQLDDLDDALRGEAFAHATGAVNVLCRDLRPCGVIRQLLQIDRFFLGHTLCTPEGMAEYRGVLDHSGDT